MRSFVVLSDLTRRLSLFYSAFYLRTFSNRMQKEIQPKIKYQVEHYNEPSDKKLLGCVSIKMKKIGVEVIVTDLLNFDGKK